MLVNFFSQTLSYGTEASKKESNLKIPLDRVAVIILSGGEGKRLAPLTKSRCKPAINFGGRYSLIDVPISHSISSGLTNIYVIGQYLANTLQKHLFRTYLNQGIVQNKIQLLVPEEKDGQKIWYKGTADAIRQNLSYFSEIPADYFLILSGDQLYNINFQDMINFGVETNAGMLIAAQPVNEKEAKRMGILKIEHGGSKIVDFFEKPQDKLSLKPFYTDKETLTHLGYEGDGKNYLGSMGIYLFKRETLFELLQNDLREDFGKHLINTQMKFGDVHAYLYDGYWEDIGTIESYYHANLALTSHNTDRKKGLHCYDEKEQIITEKHNLPGAKLSDCVVHQSLICEGCVIDAAEITHSVIGVRTRIHRGCVIRESILMGNEYFERPPLAEGQEAFRPEIGPNCLITKAIIDENVRIGANVQLINQHNHFDYESPDGLVVVRDGILVVPRGTVIPDGYVF